MCLILNQGAVWKMINRSIASNRFNPQEKPGIDFEERTIYISVSLDSLPNDIGRTIDPEQSVNHQSRCLYRPEIITFSRQCP
jgi:hypothetical protein